MREGDPGVMTMHRGRPATLPEVANAPHIEKPPVAGGTGHPSHRLSEVIFIHADRATLRLGPAQRASSLPTCEQSARSIVKVLKGNVGLIPSISRHALEPTTTTHNARRRFAIHTTRRSGEFWRRSRAVNRRLAGSA